VGIYRDLGRNQGVFRVLFSQLTARFPHGMLSIILLLHLQHQYGDYTSAGIVLAVVSVGQATAGPLTSRLIGRLGMRPVIAVTTFVCAALVSVIAFVHLPLAATAIIGFVAGLAFPPITPAVRTV